MKKAKLFNEFNLKPTNVSSLDEGTMSEIHMMAKAAKDSADFIKSFFKEYGNKIKKNADTIEWAESLYADTVSESEVNELRSDMISGNSGRWIDSLEDRKYELKKDIKNAQIGSIINITIPKGTIIHNLAGGVFAEHKSLEKYGKGGAIYFKKSTFAGIMIRSNSDTLADIEKNSKVLESVVTEANGFQSKALIRAIIQEAKPGQKLSLEDRSRNINFLFTKMSDNAGWFCNTGPKEHKGKKVDDETTAILFGNEGMAMGIELDGTPLTKFNYKFKGRDANAKVVGLTLEESLVTEAKLARGLKPLLTIGSTITKNAGEDALLDLSDKFDSIDDEYAGTIASWLDMAIELMQDRYAGAATKKLKQFNKACKDVLNGKEIGSAFESVTEVNESADQKKFKQFWDKGPETAIRKTFGKDYDKAIDNRIALLLTIVKDPDDAEKYSEMDFLSLPSGISSQLVNMDPKAIDSILDESLVAEGKTLSIGKIGMMGAKILNKISIGTIFDTKNGQYEVTGFGQQANAFKEFEATIDGKEVKVKLTAMYGIKLEVTDDVRSARYNKEEELNSIILESVVNESKIKVTKNEWPYLEFKVGGKLHKVDFDYEDIIDNHGNEGQDQYWLGKDDDGQEWMIDVYANYHGDVEEVHYDTIVKESKDAIIIAESFDAFLKLNEGKWNTIMKGVRKGDKAGPWAIVSIENGKVVNQQLVAIMDAIPAHYEQVKSEFPKAKMSIEDITGAVVYNESLETVNEWGSSDQGNFNKSMHKEMGSPKKMPSPFDDKLREVAADNVDNYWEDWEEYDTDREGLIDNAVRHYLRAFFKKDFEMMTKMFASNNLTEGMSKSAIKKQIKEINQMIEDEEGGEGEPLTSETLQELEIERERLKALIESYLIEGSIRNFKFGMKQQYTYDDVNDTYGFWGTLLTNMDPESVEEIWNDTWKILTSSWKFSDAAALYYLNAKAGRWLADKIWNDINSQISQPDAIDMILSDYARPSKWKAWAKEYNEFAQEEALTSESVVYETFDNGLNEEKTATEILADDVTGELYTATLKGKSVTIKATTTTKEWEDGVPVLKYLARGRGKSVKVEFNRSFDVVHDVAHGWFYFTDGRKWFGMHQSDGYGEAEDLPFNVVIKESELIKESKMDRDDFMDHLKKKFTIDFCKTTEEFNDSEGGVWLCGECGETYKGKMIYNYYSEDYKNYELGVLNKFEREINKIGWYSEWYDAGTVMIWPL